MPTATSLSGSTLLNIGPLTTTFTAPASCSTAYRTLIAPAKSPAHFQWNAQCPWLPPADCNPHGSAVRSIISSAEGTNPAAGMFVVYNSPGLVCPLGWATVGAANKPNPTSTSISGAFNLSGAIPTGSGVAFFQPQLDVFLAALDPGETAILCCPSSYTATEGACYSTLPKSVFNPTGGCGAIVPKGNLGIVSGTWTIGGQTITGGLYSITATTPMSLVTTSFEPSRASSYVGVAVEGLAILVHQASDIVTTSSTVSTSTKTNSATSMRGTGNGVGVVDVVYCLSFVLAALLTV